MEAKIQKQIIDYFSFIEEFYNSTKTCLKHCQKCAVAINKLITRCKNIKEADVKGTPLEEFEGLQSKLYATLHNLISEEILEIRSQLSSIEELLEKLCNKHRVLQESCRDIDFNQQSLLVTGTPFQPPLRKLLEFAEDILTFGSQIFAQVETSLTVFTIKRLKTEPLIDNFKISSFWQRRIPEIIAYTSFCSENEL